MKILKATQPQLVAKDKPAVKRSRSKKSPATMGKAKPSAKKTMKVMKRPGKPQGRGEGKEKGRKKGTK